MKTFLNGIMRDLTRIALPLLLVSAVWAQDNPCDIPPGSYRTQTQGGWGTVCRGGNPGCVRDANFVAVFPAGLTIGGNYTILFTTSAAVRDYLPAGGTPAVLTGNLVDPASTPAGVFAGQVTALAISLGFSNAGVAGFPAGLGSLFIPTGIYDPFGEFAGWSVNQIFALANTVLGGNTAALPAGISVSDLNDVVDAINNDFVDGTLSGGYLVERNCDEVLPVELASFDAVAAGAAISVRWTTASESDVDRYALQRRSGSGEWTALASVPSHGNSATGHPYSYTDGGVSAGTTYTYRLTVHELDGSTVTYSRLATATAGGSNELPAEFALHQNYPNPFNPATTIAFALAEAATVRLNVYDIAGRWVATLASGVRDAGMHSVAFDGANLSAGVYFYRLEAGTFSATRKLMLLK